MKVIEYGEKSCQGMLLTSPKKRKTWRKAVSYFCSQVGRKNRKYLLTVTRNNDILNVTRNARR